MPGIALNFFPLAADQFTVSLYRFPYAEDKRPFAADEQAVRRSLEVNGIRDNYWTLFQQIEGGTVTVCEPFDNIYATIDALRQALLQSCHRNIAPNEFQVFGGFRRRIEITTATHPEGLGVITLEPYFLRSRGQFGFLADSGFHPNGEHAGSRRALQLSLSLDRNGRPNRSRYADKYSLLSDFIGKFHSVIFPLTLPGGQTVDIDTRLVELNPEKLDMKHYVVGSGSESRSQFMGVKQSGPLVGTPTDTHLCFLYCPEDRTLSHDLLRALRGNTFRTFPGMEQMFGLSIGNDRVRGIPLSDFGKGEIKRAAERVMTDYGGSKVVPVTLTPFSRHDDPEDNKSYWHLKHAFLSRGLPVQVVATDTVRDTNTLKWSTASIALQIFAKAGGTPWKVRPRTERCLIVGVGQAHEVTHGRIDRYFAYSVLTDSSGVFEEVRSLGESQNEDNYIQALSENLQGLFSEYSDRFSNFVVHATFAIRRRELEAIAAALSKHRSQSDEGEFVSLKFNDRNRFFGFAAGHNSRVPYESSLVRLSNREFLIWFEGLQYGQPTVGKMISNPVHVQFAYPLNELSRERERAHLQDAINLSGANWRGFNAKSLPVSIYYAQLIAKYLKEFENQGLPSVDVNTLTPWFL